MAKKKYDIREKVAYHEKRVGNPRVSDGKKLYSKQWLSGYHDKYPEVNYCGACHELNFRKKDKGTPRNYKIMLTAYRNGLKAQLDSRK